MKPPGNGVRGVELGCLVELWLRVLAMEPPLRQASDALVLGSPRFPGCVVLTEPHSKRLGRSLLAALNSCSHTVDHTDHT